MVNQSVQQLLSHLKSSDAPVSGAALSRQLGISRVALWKRFESLRAAGYPVEADHRGYRLGATDKPLPWEFPGDEDRTFHFETLGSTMDEALRLGLAGLAEGAVVAERQDAGRGRADRSWTSAGGDLLVTLVLRPRLPVTYAGALGLEALTALAETLDELYHLPLSVKWPNDLVDGRDPTTGEGRKVAGVLVEAWGPVDAPRFYTLGLGLNVHGLPDLDRPVASVDGLGPVRADRRAILAGWRQKMARWSAAPTLSPDRWSRGHLPRPVRVETFDGRTASGTSQGYDRTGALVLGGTESITIRYGEVRRTQGV